MKYIHFPNEETLHLTTVNKDFGSISCLLSEKAVTVWEAARRSADDIELKPCPLNLIIQYRGKTDAGMHDHMFPMQKGCNPPLLLSKSEGKY